MGLYIVWIVIIVGDRLGWSLFMRVSLVWCEMRLGCMLMGIIIICIGGVVLLVLAFVSYLHWLELIYH